MKGITFDSYQIESLKRATLMIKNKVRESGYDNKDTQVILASVNEIEKIIQISENEIKQQSKMLIRKIKQE